MLRSAAVFRYLALINIILKKKANAYRGAVGYDSQSF